MGNATYNYHQRVHPHCKQKQAINYPFKSVNDIRHWKCRKGGQVEDNEEKILEISNNGKFLQN